MQYGPFTLAMVYHILLSIVCSFSGFWKEGGGGGLLVIPSVFPSLFIFCKLLNVLWVLAPGAVSCSRQHAALVSCRLAGVQLTLSLIQYPPGG